MNVGYVRVSSYKQNEERQLDDIQVDKTYTEKKSGKNTSDRPVLAEMIDFVREGDTVHVHSIDRLARDLQNLQDIIETLVKKRITVEFHKEKLTFNGDDSPMNKLLLQMLGAVAQFERAMIRERQAEGIAKAKKKGKKFGQPEKITGAEVDQLILMASDGVPKAEIAKKFDVSRQSIYNYLRRAMEQEGK